MVEWFVYNIDVFLYEYCCNLLFSCEGLVWLVDLDDLFYKFFVDWGLVELRVCVGSLLIFLD